MTRSRPETSVGRSAISGTPDSIALLYVVSSLSGGGAERIAVELVQSLDRADYQSSLASLDVDGPYRNQVPQDVPLVDFSDCRRWWSIVRGVWRLRNVVSEQRPDVIISSLIGANSLLMRAAPFLPSKPALILTVQNNLSCNLKLRSVIGRTLKAAEIGYLYERADAVVAVSGGVKHDLVQNFCIDEDRVVVIPNFVDVMRVREQAKEPPDLPWPVSSGTPLLTAVGRCVPQKGYRDLLAAFERLRGRLACRMVILGDGPLREELQKEAEHRGLAEDVFMPGFVENPWSVLGISDVFVSSSHWEGFSLTHLEAMACGLPVVLTDCDYGPRELVDHGRNGLLVPVSSPVALADAVEKVFRNDSLRRRLGSSARRTAEAYDKPRIVAKYDDLFRTLAADSSDPA